MRQIGETSAWVHNNGLYGGGAKDRPQQYILLNEKPRKGPLETLMRQIIVIMTNQCMLRYPVMLFPLYQITEASLGCASARRCVSQTVFMFTKGYRHRDHLSSHVSPT